MTVVKRHMLGDAISKKLRKAIISGDYPHHYHLAEPQLAEQLGVSRGPVRDALQLLVQEGFAERLPNGRVRVKSVELQDIRNLYEFRTLLETMAAEKWMTGGHAPFPQAEFDDILAQMEKRTITSEEFAAWDVRFHQRIVELSGNKTLMQAWVGLEEVVQSILEITNKGNPRAETILSHHAEIVKALAARDLQATKSLIGAHLKEAEEVMVNELGKWIPNR